MTTKLLTALREKYPDPRAALRALGLDESLARDALSTETDQMAKPTRLANTALQLTTAMVRPLMAKDAKFPDLMPIFKDVTTKTFDAKKITIALDAAFKGKLAKDAEPHMGHVAQLMDHLGGAVDPKTADESVSEPQHKAMEAAAHGESELGIPPKVGKEFTSKDASMEPLRAYLKGKGASDEDIDGACDMVSSMMPPNALDEAETEEEKKAREEKAAKDKAAKDEADKETERKAAEDKAKDEEMKDMVKKPAMDAAIAAAVQATEKRMVETQRGIRAALAEVRPYVGELSDSLAIDSADDVYRHALTIKGIAEAKTIHPSALRTVLQQLPKAGARAVEQRSMATDSAGAASFAERHPEIAGIQSI